MTPSHRVCLAALPALCLALGGCPEDDNFTFVSDGGGSGGGDMALPPGADLAGVDFAFPPGTDLAGVDFTVVNPPDLKMPQGDMAQAAATYPQLLVSVEDYSNSGNWMNGRVVRFDLPSLARTGDLTGQGSLPSDAWAVGAYPGKKVLIAGSNTLVMLDATTDSALWHVQTNASDMQPPMATFWLQSPSGPVPALAWGDLGSSLYWPTDLMYVDTFDPNTGTLKNHWASNSSTDGQLETGLSVTGVQQSPFDPSHLLLNKSDSTEAWGVADLPAPWQGQRVTTTSYVAPSGIPANGGIYAMSVVVPPAPVNGVVRRLAWVWDNYGAGDRVYYINDSSSSLQAMAIAGPIPMCGDATLCKQPDSIYSAVPDPTDTTSFYAICDAPGTSNPARNVVKMSSAGGCSMVLDAAAQLIPRTRPTQLAIAVSP